MFAPIAASSIAEARPIPLLAPVTKAVLPTKLFVSSNLAPYSFYEGIHVVVSLTLFT